jgi:hypothetical protein
MYRLTEPVADLAAALRRKALADLEYHSTSDSGFAAYRFQYDGQWIAVRADNGRVLAAASPEDLSVAVATDYAEEPVRRDDERHP